MKKLSIACSILLMICIAMTLGALYSLTGCTAADKKVSLVKDVPMEVAAAPAEEEEDGRFSERDMNAEPDLSQAKYVEVKDNDQVVISNEGIYVLSGDVKDAIITVTADKQKVQLVLDGLNMVNEDSPVIYVESADKVFITTVEGSHNKLTVSGEFTTIGDVNTDGVIFSRDDLTLNGKGELEIESTYNGIVCKDSMKITGGTYSIQCVKDAVEVKDTIDICGGVFNIETEKDGINCSNTDDVVCEVYISDGIFNINAGSTGIQVDARVTIDGGTFSIRANEGIEATYVLINDGSLDIYAYDDGINAARGSNAYDVAIEINGGDVNVEAGPGDTDGLDANGSIYINGGTVSVTAQSAFDYDFLGELNGGTVFVNGEQVYELTPSMMGGSHGGKGGDRGGSPGGPGFGEEMGW